MACIILNHLPEISHSNLQLFSNIIMLNNVNACLSGILIEF